MSDVLPDKTASLDPIETLHYAAALAEKYGEAIIKISAALEDGTPGGIKRAQAIIAGLAPEESE